MRNIKLTLAYDGSDFHGWQLQPGVATIQGALADVARKITQEKIFIHGASRTDAGVHALGQVAHFKTHSPLSAAEFQRALNALLPPAIRVAVAEEVGPDFHARWQALAKTYQYRIFRGRVVPPFEWRRVLHYPWPLDARAMAEAARMFEGEHDFTSFAASSGSEEDHRDRNTLRMIYRSELLSRPYWPPGTQFSRPGMSAADVSASGPPGSDESAASVPTGAQGFSPDIGAGQGRGALAPDALPRDEELVYVVRGKSFLRYMVRKIVGTLLEVGKGKITPADIAPLFNLRDRSRSGQTVPPEGLYLVSLEYPDPTASLGTRAGRIQSP